MGKIRNILFDLGGVLIDMHPERCKEAFLQLGLPEIAELINPYHPAAMIGELEKGEISFSEMCQKMRDITHRSDIKDEEIASAYNALIGEIAPWKLHLLEELREKGYHLYALSNNNPMSFAHEKTLFQIEGKHIEDYFEQIFLSFELGELKPGKAIYEKMLSKGKFGPEETLFLDDSALNVNVARELGFSVYMPSPDEDFREIFAHLDFER